MDSKPAFSNADATRVRLQATVYICNINFISLEGMKQKDIEKELSAHPDFAAELSVVEKMARDAGQFCKFLSKFHCECNKIEQLWAEAKRATRRRCNYSITYRALLVKNTTCNSGVHRGLLAIVGPALDAVDIDRIRSLERRGSTTTDIYRSGIIEVMEVKKALKKYKTHRRVLRLD